MIVPIIVGANEAATAVQGALADAGFDVRAIRPPSVAPGTARLRVTIRYPVSDDDLLRFAAVAAPLLGADHGPVMGSDPNHELSRVR